MPTTGHESEALHHTWTAVVTCDGFTFNHYAACYFDDVAGSFHSAPTTPGDSGAHCYDLSTSQAATSKDNDVFRSDRYYSSRIFACTSAIGTCTHYYGDGTRGVTPTNDSDEDTTTDFEHWLMQDIGNYYGYSSANLVVSTASGIAPGAMFYPGEWADHDHLGLWWGEQDGSNSYIIRYKEASTAGWLNFASTSWSSTITVARESDGGDYDNASHPWVVPAVDTSGTPDTYYVRMYLQTGSGTNYLLNSFASGPTVQPRLHGAGARHADHHPSLPGTGQDLDRGSFRRRRRRHHRRGCRAPLRWRHPEHRGRNV